MTTERGVAARPGKPRRKSGNDRACQWPQVALSAVGGMALFGFFAYAGHSYGLNGPVVSRPAPVLGVMVVPSPTLRVKRALISDAALASATPRAEVLAPVILASVKSDFLRDEAVVLGRGDRLMGLINTPPISKLETGWRIVREGRRRIVAERKARLAEHSCLARAVYFEARSESELGQLAVAQVVLNRVKNPLYPDTICDVVYQDAEQTNSCQFSFACDQLSDVPQPGKAWEQAKKVAARAMAGNAEVQVVSTATNYHADYVRPKWTDSMTRLIQIGRHIFYTDG